MANKLLNKESLNGVFAEIKRELDNIPQNVTATVVVGGEVKQATVTRDGAGMNIAFPNLKGDKGDQGIQGEQGRPGMDFQPIGDVSGLNIAQSTGQSESAIMSQKAVTETVEAAKDYASDYIEVKFWCRVINATIPANAGTQTIASSSSGNSQWVWYVKVKRGDKITITASNSSTAGFRYAFSQVTPAVGVEVQNNVPLSDTSINVVVTAPIDGYLVINHKSTIFTDRVVRIREVAKASEVGAKADEKNLLDLVGITMPLAADEDVTGTDTGYQGINLYGGLVTASGSTSKVYTFPIEGKKIYHIKGRVGNNTGYAGYAFLDADGYHLGSGEIGTSTARNFETIIVSPKDAATLYVAGNIGVGFYSAEVSRIVPSTTEEQKATVRENLGIKGMATKTIYPVMSRDYLNTSGGMGHSSSAEVDVRCIVSTARYVKVNGDVNLTTANNRFVRVEKYGSDFSFLSYSDISVNGGEQTTISVGSASYIKLMLAADNTFATQIPMERIAIEGTFEDNWDVFNTRSSDSGYQRIAVAVNTTDPNSCDDETDGMQDEGTMERDYGVVVLPANYQNIGEPTRLIIYCHGAAVNYGWSNTRFDSDDLLPGYWLAEGYAVMDVEGNPYDNRNEHFYMPQAMDCYIAAYNWVIEHYNIKRDGVFLGGRSMGGGMTFNLLRRECPIPIIAACPNVPASIPTFYWNYMDSERRTFCARKYGLIGENDTMTGTSPMPSNEWDILKANFDKLVKYSPVWSLITDLPPKDDLLDDRMNISKNASYNEYEEEFYAPLHMQVKAPVKIFGVKDDTTCYYQRTSVLLYKMLRNGGNIVELRLFQSGGHHADVQNTNMELAEVTTRYGTVVEHVPVVYVEMLKFWRRFEQE